MQHTKKVAAQFAEIPREKLGQKLLRLLVLAPLFGAAAVWGASHEWSPWLVALFVLLAGMMVSLDLVGKALRIVVAILVDLGAAVGGRVFPSRGP